MNKKLFTQIKNEWRSSVWLFIELLLVSVVMWYIVDYVYVKATVYMSPRGYDVSNCYKITMAQISSDSPDYNPEYADTEEEDVRELVNRLKQRTDVMAIGLGEYSHPYQQRQRTTLIEIDSMVTDGYVYQIRISPDVIRVFQYQGSNGESSEQLAELLERKTFLASDDIFFLTYGKKLSSYIGRDDFQVNSGRTKNLKLAATLMPIRYDDFTEAINSPIMIGFRYDMYSYMEIYLRVNPDQDIDFIDKIKMDSKKNYRIGNVYIADIQSFKDIRRIFQQESVNELRNYLFGISFLLLNIFIGLLGTFWFRTNRRRSQIALMKSFGANRNDVFIRLITEGFIILCLATIPAIIIDFNIANAELNAWRNSTTLEIGRFIVTVLISFALIAIMMLIGIWIPARKAMKIEPAEALRDE